MPELTDLTDLTNEVASIARDTAYVVVGLGVLGFQRAQVQRVELKSKLGQDLGLEERLTGLRTAVYEGVKSIDGFVEHAFQYVESTLEPLEEQLPASARDLAQKARTQAREVRTQIRGAVVPAA